LSRFVPSLPPSLALELAEFRSATIASNPYKRFCLFSTRPTRRRSEKKKNQNQNKEKKNRIERKKEEEEDPASAAAVEEE
jgi:hypothetical protein